MTKVALFYGYSRKNAGDMAITLGAIDVLLRTGCTLTVVSRYSEESSEYADSKNYLENRYGDRIAIAPCPFILDRDESMLRQIRNYFVSLLALLGFPTRRQFIELVEDADLLVFNGGNLFRCESLADFLRLLALTHPFRLAKRRGINYVVFPQSCSTINKIGRRMVGNLLKHSRLNLIREDQSHERLKEYFPSVDLQRTIDLAFLIDFEMPGRPSDQRDKIAAFTVRGTTVGDLRELADTEKKRISAKVVHIASQAILQGFKVVFVVQTRKDAAFTQDIVDSLNTNNNCDVSLVFSTDPIELVEFYGTVSTLIGMRLHSIILAVSRGTICHGLFYREWGLKNPGLMNMFSLQYDFLEDQSSDFFFDDKLMSDGVRLWGSVTSLIETERTRILTLLTDKIV